MDGDADVFNEDFDDLDYEMIDETNIISVSDVIGFFQAVRAASQDKITELCNSLDDTVEMSSNSIIKMIKEFAEERRNSFSSDGDKLEDISNFHNTSGNLEGCGGDVSLFEPDLGELILRNKNLSHSNTNLRAENSELRKQLEAFEDECENQRGTIAALDKDLKHYQVSKPDVQLLLKEKDEMQTRVQTKEEEISSLRHREKIVKEESEDYRLRLSCLQDQYDGVSVILDQLRKENMKMEQENIAVKSNCDSFQLSLENKDEQLVLDLQEEKEALSVQVREMQFEYSICQKAVTGSAPGTPVRISIQHELNQADDCIGENEYPSPICGTNYVKGTNKQLNSPLTENLRKGLLSYIMQTPPSPRQQQDCRSSSKPESYMSDSSSQTNEVFLSNDYVQTIKKELYEFAAQTESKKVIEMYTQTEMENSRNDLTSIEREDRMFEEQSSLIEGCYKDQIVAFQQDIEDLKLSLDREKNKSQYLTTQVGANRAKIYKLQETLGKEQEKVTELANINVKLCSSKLDMWWNDNHTPDDDSKVIQEEKSESHISQLIDALSLAGTTVRKIPNFDSDLLHGQDISHVEYTMEGGSKAWEQISLASQADRTTFPGRSSILNTCKEVIEQAIEKKVELLLEMLCEIVFYDDHLDYDESKRRLNYSFSSQLISLQNLTTKLGKVNHDIGAREQEYKMTSVLKVLSNRLSSLKKKYEESRAKLCQLFHISLHCQCFSALNMLSVLKDIEHDDEIFEKNVQLHQKRIKEIVNLDGPVVQNQILQLQQKFNQLDDSLTQVFGRNLPARKWLMMILFVFTAYFTFQWEDYHVPPIV
uniref:227 kDa spindle- and centromere-associated protein-like isoform X2 n=1 Tax=Styela clava TaxID=7725 RepID=UPI001939D119|nr:227 kDa spindle- and centromere-associated protein-like isoform X2 [Styela clava]